MPQPVAFNTSSSISGSIQSSRISYAIETSGSNYRAGYAGKNWYSELPATTGVVFIKDTTAIGRGNPGNPAFWITNGTSSAAILATANGLPGSPRNFTNTGSAYSWSLANGFFINDPNEPFNQIDTDSLVLYLDASKTVSYPTTASTWYDISGNNDSGSLLNGITYNNNALVFDGIDDNVLIESYISMSNPTTVCALINRSITSSGNQVFFGPQANGQDNWLSISSNYLSLFGTQTADINNFGITGVTFMSSSRWYFATGIINGPTASIYLNGNLENTVTQSFNIGGWGGPTRIGTRYTTQFPFPGQISNVQAYNKVLTQTEILQNYYQAPIVTNGLVTALDAGNLVSYESGSTILYSLTGSVSGSLINGTNYNNNNGGSWVFDGIDDYISIPSNSSLDATDNFTITITFKSTNWTTNNQEGLFEKGNVNNYAAYLRGTLGSISFYTSPTAFWDSGLNVGGTNLWNIVTFVYSYSQLGFKQIYVNGSFSSQIAITNPITSNTSSLTLGYASSIAGPRYFKGNIASLYMYNRVLTSTEILQNFNAQRNRFNI